MSDMSEELSKKYKKAAKIINRSGMLPFPISDTFIKILRVILDEEDIDFILNFNKKISLSMDQLKEATGLSEEEITRLGSKVAKKGFMMDQPSSSGILIFRVMPIIMIGAFEYTYMKEIKDGVEKEKAMELAGLYKVLLKELREGMQSQYDSVMPKFKKMPPFDRTVRLENNLDGTPIEIKIDEKLEDVGEKIVPAQTVKEIIEKFDEIAVGNCFCRHYHVMLGGKCETDAPMVNCFTFGKSAKHVVKQGFAKMISKDEALKILQEAEDAGLVHKTFHNKSDIYNIENSICNCCKDCCDTFQLWRMGAIPLVNSTNYLSNIDEEKCTGCETCVDRCPVDAISLNDDGKAEVTPEYCIGCGVCAHFCPENAISLKEGLRDVFVLPPRLRT
ncbi:MAG: 4Fe-4S binding protein [Candidatus Hodarchaeota archaeon]